MHPTSALDLAIVARNARAWAAYAGTPIRAVLKCDGYNWGAARMAAALADACEAFCVADSDEFRALRPHAALPIVVLGAIDPLRLAEILDAGGLPTIATRDELAIATDWAASRDRALKVRVGVMPATGWSGLDLPAIDDFASALSDEDVAVEVWTHVTDAIAAAEQVARLHKAVAIMRRRGVNVTAIDAGSTFSVGDRSAPGDSARIGVGLFGATGGSAVPGVACAIGLRAPVVRSEEVPAGARIGYGARTLVEAARVATARCGYGDGLPKEAAGADDILSVGMQYTLIRSDRVPGDEICLLDERTDLDAFAAHANRGVHEIVTNLGAAARNMESR